MNNWSKTTTEGDFRYPTLVLYENTRDDSIIKSIKFIVNQMGISTIIITLFDRDLLSQLCNIMKQHNLEPSESEKREIIFRDIYNNFNDDKLQHFFEDLGKDQDTNFSEDLNNYIQLFLKMTKIPSPTTKLFEIFDEITKNIETETDKQKFISTKQKEIKDCISNGANINAVSNFNERSFLSKAIKSGEPTLVQTVLESGADIHYKASLWVDIPLFGAIQRATELSTSYYKNEKEKQILVQKFLARQEIVMLLIEKTDVNLVMKDYPYTPLYTAFNSPNINIFLMLMLAGADLSFKHYFYRLENIKNPFREYNPEENKYVSVAEMLLKRATKDTQYTSNLIKGLQSISEDLYNDKFIKNINILFKLCEQHYKCDTLKEELQVILEKDKRNRDTTSNSSDFVFFSHDTKTTDISTTETNRVLSQK